MSERKKSKLYAFWVEVDGKPQGIYTSRVTNTYVNTGSVAPNQTLTIWFKESDFCNSKGEKTILVKREPEFRHCETFDQFVNVFLEWMRKDIQKQFDKRAAKMPEGYRIEFKVRFGRVNSKTCPFWLPVAEVQKEFNKASIFSGGCGHLKELRLKDSVLRRRNDNL